MTAAASTLTPVQEQGIVALLNEPTIRKAAESVGVSERTMHRWFEDPAFEREFQARRRESYKQALGLVHKAVPLAVATLIGVAQDKTAPHAAKVSAATALLKHSRESQELDDLALRLRAVEQQLAAQRGRP